LPANVRASCSARFFVASPDIDRRLALLSKGNCRTIDPSPDWTSKDARCSIIFMLRHQSAAPAGEQQHRTTVVRLEVQYRDDDPDDCGNQCANSNVKCPTRIVERLKIAPQSLLAQAGVISAAKLAVCDARLASVLLIAAGLYQVTPIKRVCLAQCRSPASFLMREWRPGWGGSIRLGVLHGLYCLGCCWLLMALLFIGGVMNLAWVALLAASVLAERVLPIGERAALAIGGLTIAAGFAVLLAPDLMGLRT
jgi:hypothetical protein